MCASRGGFSRANGHGRGGRRREALASAPSRAGGNSEAACLNLVRAASERRRQLANPIARRTHPRTVSLIRSFALCSPRRGALKPGKNGHATKNKSPPEDHRARPVWQGEAKLRPELYDFGGLNTTCKNLLNRLASLVKMYRQHPPKA